MRKIVRAGRPYWVIDGELLPVIAGGGGDPPDAPDMSPEEKQYYATMSQSISQAMANNQWSAELQRAMLPYLFQEFGYSYTPGADVVSPTSFTYQPPPPVPETAEQRIARSRNGDRVHLPARTIRAQPQPAQTIGRDDPRWAELVKAYEAGTLGEGYTATTETRPGAPTIAKLPKTESQQLASDLETEYNRQALAALRGEMPVSPALEQALKESRQQQATQLQQELGPGWQTSTPGIEATTRRGLLEDALRDETRYGRISTLDALGRARQSDRQGASGQTFAMLQGGPQGVAAGYNASAQAAQGLAVPAGAYQNQRMVQYQADLQKYQQKLASRNALIQMGLGAGIGAATGGLGLLGANVGTGASGAGYGALLGAMSPQLPGNLAMMNYLR